MSVVSKVLIVGAGPAGLSSAVALRDAGVDVEVVEVSPTREVPGSELMIGGSFLRALDVLGVAERCVKVGVGLNATMLCRADGQVLAEVALVEAFVRRRYERCRMVVENAQQLGEWEQEADSPDTGFLSAALTEQSWATLAEPI